MPHALGTQKKIDVPHLLGKNTRKGPTQTFRNHFWGRKRAPKRAILGHKSLCVCVCFFFCSYGLCKRSSENSFFRSSGPLGAARSAHRAKRQHLHLTWGALLLDLASWVLRCIWLDTRRHRTGAAALFQELPCDPDGLLEDRFWAFGPKYETK